MPIELISIAMVDDQDRSRLWVNSGFDWNECDSKWLHDNVRPHLARPNARHGRLEGICSEILEFVGGETPEFWAYFAAYDHVVLSQIFGTMMDLPSASWMHTMDLKQEMRRLGVKKDELPGRVDKHCALADARWVRDSLKWIERTTPR